MHVGIVVHSKTGNTLSVAQKIQKELEAKGHTAEIQRVTARNEEPKSAADIVLSSAPDVTPYDALIFGAPVHAFSLSLVMKAYLSQLPSLEGKKVACFITQQIAKPFFGGKRTIKQMVALCGRKGAEVELTGTVGWSAKNRDEQIAGVAAKMGSI